MAKDLDISTSVGFVVDRTYSTSAVQEELSSVWIWPTKTLAQWDVDTDQLNESDATTLAGKRLAENAAYQSARGALEARIETIHEWSTIAVGVMRVRAKQDPSLAQAVARLKARSNSWTAIEKRGSAVLATWTSVFTNTFTPAPGKTLAAFQALFDGDNSIPASPVPSLAELKATHKQAEKKARLAVGKYNRLITRLEDECTQWYAEATKVFAKSTAEGAMIRGSIPTSDDHNPPTGAPTPITIASISVTGSTSVMITYAPVGGAGSTSRKLQWRFSSAPDWTVYGAVIRPNQLASMPGWAGQTVFFRVEVQNSRGTAYSPESSATL